MEERNRAEEVILLKELCRSLDSQRKKSRQEAVEWQNFGRFTAAVLQKEADGFERKLRVLQERMGVLVRENDELKGETSRGKRAVEGSGFQHTRYRKLGGREDASSKAPVHSMCAEEMNRDTSPLLHYPGMTSESTLRDKKTLSLLGTKNADAAVAMLQKRLEKVEAEKLELVKSLSAAHLLTAAQPHHPTVARNTSTTSSLSPPSPVSQPTLSPEFQSLLDSCRADEGQPLGGGKTPNSGLDVSADVILQAVTLLDMCKRLDAQEQTGFRNKTEEKEVAILRVLMSIAWQKLQEDIKPKS